MSIDGRLFTPEQQFGERREGKYKMPLLPGETGTKGGGDWVPYHVSSVTNLLDGVEESRGLSIWEQEQALIGLARQPSLFEEVSLAVAGWDREGVDYSRIRDFPHVRRVLTGGGRQEAAEASIIGRAKQAAGANEARQAGTNRHKAWEHRAKTGDLIGTPEMQRQILVLEALLEENFLARVPELCERTVRCPEMKVAGRFDDVLMSTRTGRLYLADLKGLALDTPLATPTGWTTMGGVQIGDYVYDKDGVPTQVTGKSSVKQIGTYVVRFDDGSEIVCDSEHIWYTGISGKFYGQEARPRSIQEVIETQRSPRSGQNQHVVPVAGALQAPTADLPVEPYLFGAWLGDGQRAGGVITGWADTFEALRQAGHVLGKCTRDKRRPTTLYYSVLGLRKSLRVAGLLGHKTIPDAYLRAAPEQRLALLQGLMDTDGTWNTARRTAVFYSVDKALATQVTELLSSLGQRPYMAAVDTHGFGKDVVSYHVSFTPVGIMPFRLPRKAVQAAASTKSTTVSGRRLIVSIEPGPDVLTACIAVDSPSSTYLAGEKMIPTHNTKRTKFRSWMATDGQLSLYARSPWMLTPDMQSYEPGPQHYVDQHRGIVLQMPSDGTQPYLRPADLDYGWEVAEIARTIADLRSYGKSAERARLGAYWLESEQGEQLTS